MLGAETWLTYRLVIILFERMGVGRVDSRNIPIPNPEKALGPVLGSDGGAGCDKECPPCCSMTAASSIQCGTKEKAVPGHYLRPPLQRVILAQGHTLGSPVKKVGNACYQCMEGVSPKTPAHSLLTGHQEQKRTEAIHCLRPL